MSVNKTITPINNLEIKKLKNAHFLSISNKHAVPEPDAICCIANPNNNFPIGLSVCGLVELSGRLKLKNILRLSDAVLTARLHKYVSQNCHNEWRLIDNTVENQAAYKQSVINERVNDNKLTHAVARFAQFVNLVARIQTE